jgi:DNA polymerase V
MSHGGARKGAGRKSSYGCETKAIRVPALMIAAIQKYVHHKGYQLPLYESKVPAGFPSPADDHIEASLDLNEYLIKHPAATFLVRVSGHSMIDAGIHENDMLVVDRSIQPAHGKVVVAAVDGLLTVKRLHKNHDGKFMLIPDNPQFDPIVIDEESNVYIWGVVTNVIHAV